MTNPKLRGSASWYGYYAGFSDRFVGDVIRAFRPSEVDALVLDPWNGSGTTTTVAARLGLASLGIDINPVMAHIAVGRSLDRDIAPSLLPLARDIRAHAKRGKASVSDDEPLLAWFDERTAMNVRAIERSIDRGLVEPRSSDDALPFSSLSAFFYVALFSTVRKLAKPFATTNPTWIKVAREPGERLYVSGDDVEHAFEAAVRRLSDLLQARPEDWIQPTIAIGRSEGTTLGDGWVQLVIGSPPYCTRIDYLRATLPELAVLGISTDERQVLRESMIGSPTLHAADPTVDPGWGYAAMTFLERVQAHDSKASNTYYSKYYRQYFAGIYSSLSELKRVVSVASTTVLVVQDSFYKEIHLALPRVFEEMARQIGWNRIDTHEFDSKTKAVINPGARKYRETFGAVETVLVCR